MTSMCGAAGSGVTLIVIAMSTDGGGGWEGGGALAGCASTVVDAVAELFPELGSAVEEDTDAVFASVPAALGRTTIVTVAVAAFASVPRAQVTVVVPEQLPWLELVETKLAPPGSMSVTLTPAAGFGPVLETVKV